MRANYPPNETSSGGFVEVSGVLTTLQGAHGFCFASNANGISLFPH